MSASSKKKLRAEAASAKMTERQLAEKKEAKKVKIYTIAFAAVTAVLLVVAIAVGSINFISGSGIRERSTTALTVGSHKLSNAELNYYYIDGINNFYSQNGSYAALFGLDLTAPLDQQTYNEETGETWADFFLESAENTARATYALADEAAANGFTLTDEQMADVNGLEDALSTYAAMSGTGSAEAYLKAYYGNGSKLKTFKEYYRLNTLANAYQVAYSASLTYPDEVLRAQEKENPNAYSSYSYNQYYLSANRFAADTDDSDAALLAAEETAKALTSDEIKTVADLDAAIAALEINEGTSASSNAIDKASYSSINSQLADWITAASRKDGDKTYIADVSTTANEDGTETTVTSGYYVVFFRSADDNKTPMVNVRHILVSFEGGTTEDGVTTYSQGEKMIAQAGAESILAEWKAGEATEDSFAALANEKSTDPGSSTNGGLYENVYTGQMVPAFNDWCFDQSRKPGDTGIVETDYGYHVMYFVGQCSMNYRDYLITSELRGKDVNDWYNNLIDSTPMAEADTSFINKSLVLSAS